MDAGLTPLWISVKTSLLATVITFFLGIGTAYLVANYKGKWRGVIDSIFTLPLVLPPTVLGFFLTICSATKSLRVLFDDTTALIKLFGTSS